MTYKTITTDQIEVLVSGFFTTHHLLRTDIERIGEWIEKLDLAEAVEQEQTIVPVEFAEPSDYDKIQSGDEIEIADLLKAVRSGNELIISNRSRSYELKGKLNLSARDRDILLAGGLLNYTRGKSGE